VGGQQLIQPHHAQERAPTLTIATRVGGPLGESIQVWRR